MRLGHSPGTSKKNLNKTKISLGPNEYSFSDKANGVKAAIEFDAHARLCELWEDALILKSSRGHHTIGYLYARLSQKWAPKHAWQLIDLPNDLYVARFADKEDRNFALTRGPWMIEGHSLVLQQ